MSTPLSNEKQIDALTAIAGKTVLVVGDIMLDQFVYGRVDRISPETPVPILAAERTETMLGGAGNVVANLTALGAKAEIISVIGDDTAGQNVKSLLETLGVSSRGIHIDAARPTICKTRYIGRNQHLLRVDYEDVKDLAAAIETRCLAQIQEAVKAADVVVLSDYAKGVLTSGVIAAVIKAAQKNNTPVLVDPKSNDYTRYNGASIVTPNRTELSAATGGMAVNTDADIEAACALILKDVDIGAIVATRSEAGMSVIERDKAPVHISHNVHEVYDVSGAGDTVIAVLAAVIAGGSDIVMAATLANVAGGIAVSKIGTSQVKAAEIKAALMGNAPKNQAAMKYETVRNEREPYVCELDAATAQIREWQAQGQRVGFTNGCFDILHFGHVSYLNKARDKCDRLVVGLNHDQSVRILKGADRPVNDENARAAVIGALGCVDMVVFFGATQAGDDNTPCGILGTLKPDVIFKGGDYKVEDLPEAKIVQAYGGAVDIMPLYEGHSTTAIIEKTRKSDAA